MEPTLDSDLKYDKALNNNWLLWSILVTLFCCQILGIVSIVFAALGNSERHVNPEKALRHYEKAKLFFWLAFGSGVILILVYFGALVSGVLADGAYY